MTTLWRADELNEPDLEQAATYFINGQHHWVKVCLWVLPLYLRVSNIVKQGFKKQASLCKRDHNMSETPWSRDYLGWAKLCSRDHLWVSHGVKLGLPMSEPCCAAGTTYEWSTQWNSDYLWVSHTVKQWLRMGEPRLEAVTTYVPRREARTNWE